MSEEQDLSQPSQEWSHFIETAEINYKLTKVEVSPAQELYPALCKRLDIHAIENFTVLFELKRNSVSKVIQIKGKIKASLDQKCVVSMESVPEHVEDEFESWYAEPNQAVSFAKAKRERLSEKEREELPMLEEHDDPETVIDGKIDLGELAVQNLSLALNPYPRCENATYESNVPPMGDEPEGVYDNPFSALKNWKTDQEKKTEN